MSNNNIVKVLTASDSEWIALLDELFPGADVVTWERMRRNYTGQHRTRKGRTSNAAQPRRRYNYAADVVRQDATRKVR